MSRRSTKQRRSMRRRRRHNGDYKRRFIKRIRERIDQAFNWLAAHLADIVWNRGGFSAGDLGAWLP